MDILRPHYIDACNCYNIVLIYQNVRFIRVNLRKNCYILSICIIFSIKKLGPDDAKLNDFWKNKIDFGYYFQCCKTPDTSPLDSISIAATTSFCVLFRASMAIWHGTETARTSRSTSRGSASLLGCCVDRHSFKDKISILKQKYLSNYLA